MNGLELIIIKGVTMNPVTQEELMILIAEQAIIIRRQTQALEMAYKKIQELTLEEEKKQNAR